MMLHYQGARIRVEGEHGYREVWLARADARNAIDTAMRDELFESLSAIASDPSVRGVGLLADGPDFCAGGDLHEFGSASDVADASQVRLLRSLPQLMWRLRDRLVVGIQGAAVGAGIELAAFARRVIACPGARFRLPELEMGLIPGAGGTVSLTQRIGPSRTLQMILESCWIPAAEAQGLGLVDELVDRHLLVTRIRQVAPK